MSPTVALVPGSHAADQIRGGGRIFERKIIYSARHGPELNRLRAMDKQPTRIDVTGHYPSHENKGV